MRPGTAAVKIGMFFVVNLLLNKSIWAEKIDNWNVEGEHGELKIDGTMTDAPCTMDMMSNFQEVDLGPLNNAHLRKPGDTGQKVEFTFTLRHCLAANSRLVNTSNGTVSGASDQPVMYMEFVSASDTYNPDLVQIKGVHGIGLRLKDGRYHAVHLGQLSTPQFLNSGQNLLKYSVAIERTSEKLVLGPFHATMDFKIHYY